MLLVQMRPIVVVVMTAAVMSILVSIIGTPAVNSISAVTDNKTDAGTGGGNGNSSIEAANGRPDNGESAKSGINTTVCGPDAAHVCQTSSDGQ